MENFRKPLWFFLILASSFTGVSQNLDSLMVYGERALSQGDYEKSLIQYTEALEIANREGEDESRGTIYNNLGILHKRTGNYALSIENYNRSLEIRRRLGVDSLTAGTLYNFALVLKKNTFYDIALQRLNEAIEIFRSRTNEEMEAKSLDVVGNIYYELDDYEASYTFHKLALDIYQRSQNTRGLGQAFHNMAELYIEVDSLEKASFCIEQSWKYKEVENKSNQLNEMLKGELFLKLGNRDSSYFYFNKVLQERKAKGDKSGLISSFYHFGQFYYLTNEFEKADIYLDSAIIFARDLTDYQMQIEIIEMQIEVLKEQNKYAYITLKYETLLNLYRTYMGDKAHNMAAYFNSQYTFLKNEKALEIAKSRNALKTAENNNLSFKYRLVLSLVVVFLIVALIILFLSLRVKRKNDLLKSRNEIIESRNKTIENLLLELNHRTKNYYQMLSGMLLYDIDDEDNPEVINILRQYVARVHSMAQIQHYLVMDEEGHKTRVSLHSHLSDLIDEIDLALNHFTPPVRILKDLDPFELDYVRTCYVSIALNELVQNAFKHSFRDSRHPQISISLKVESNSLLLLVEDNGVGIQKGDKLKESSSGLRLLNQLMSKIKGELTYLKASNGGLKVQLLIHYSG